MDPGPSRLRGLPPTESSLSQEANFSGFLGATDRAGSAERECLELGWSGSDFAEEPVVRVQSWSRRL